MENGEQFVRNDDRVEEQAPHASEKLTDSTIEDNHSIQYIEKIISEGYRSIAEALEEQNRLLRKLTSTLENRTASSLDSPDTRPSPSSTCDVEEQQHEGVKSGRRHEAAQRAPSRLQKMSRATEPMDPPMISPRHPSSPTAGTHENDKVSKLSLAQRKKEFMSKTTHRQGSEIRDRTRLAIAAARREMEREKSRARKIKDIEHQESNSLGSWIMFVIIGILGIAAFVLGIVARIQQSNFYRQQQSLQSSTNSSVEL